MGTRGIVILIGLLTVVGPAGPTAAASPFPQESGKPDPDPVQRSAEVRKKEKLDLARTERNAVKESDGSPRNEFVKLGEDFLQDQKQIWTSPARLRFSDADWLVPFGGITTGLFVTDRDFSKHLSQNPTTIS